MDREGGGRAGVRPSPENSNLLNSHNKVFENRLLTYLPPGRQYFPLNQPTHARPHNLEKKFWIRAYDVEPIINWRSVSLSFQRLWIKTATLFSGSHPTYRSAIFPFIFEHAQLDTRCFSISETYGKASPFACRKTLCFMQSPGH